MSGKSFIVRILTVPKSERYLINDVTTTSRRDTATIYHTNRSAQEAIDASKASLGNKYRYVIEKCV